MHVLFYGSLIGGAAIGIYATWKIFDYIDKKYPA